MLSFDKVVGLLAPSVCIGCGSTGAILCEECLQVAGEPPAPRCVGCRQLSDNYRTCKACESWLNIYAVHVSNNLDGIYEQLVYSLKFDMKRDAVYPIATMMKQVAPDLKGQTIVCPIPTAWSRIRSRGFDHTKYISEELMNQTNTDKPSWKLSPALSRKTNLRQFGSSRAQRIKQMEEEFSVKEPNVVKGKNILLLDDVITTGATLSAAAKTLKKAGAKRIYALVFAQK